MSCYIRPQRPGATVFFTVALVDRRSDILVRHVEVLRQAVQITRTKRPFRIDAWVVLPDHMHCVWTLPEGDANFSGRMGEIKGQFTRMLRRSGPAPPRFSVIPTVPVGDGSESGQESGRAPTYGMKRRFGKSGFGSIISEMRPISGRMSGIVGSIR